VGQTHQGASEGLSSVCKPLGEGGNWNAVGQRAFEPDAAQRGCFLGPSAPWRRTCFTERHELKRVWPRQAM
jgi:hypothetical protein